MLEIYLPSGRKDARINQITANHMNSLYNAQKYKLPELLADTLQHFTNIKVREMLLEDFRYMLAMFDKDSWIVSHRMYEWRCESDFYVDATHNRYYQRPVGRKYHVVKCNRLNTEEVSKFRVVGNPWRKLPNGLRHPTVQRWIEAVELAETEGDVAFKAMWIDSDLSLDATLDNTSPEELMFAERHMFASCELETEFKCGNCFRTYKQRSQIDLLNFFRVHSSTSMMNMALDLTTSKGAYIPDDIPIAKLLYWHSCFIKDKQRAEEERLLRLQQKPRR